MEMRERKLSINEDDKRGLVDGIDAWWCRDSKRTISSLNSTRITNPLHLLILQQEEKP